jgi:transcriptional regulator with XRE-family HTH domain
MSQETLAFQAGVTKNQIQLIESGRASGRKDAAGPSNPRMSTLAGLAAVLGMSVSDMLNYADL